MKLILFLENEYNESNRIISPSVFSADKNKIRDNSVN